MAISNHEREAPLIPYSKEDIAVYEAMRYVMGSTGYEQKFRIRELDPKKDPLGVLRIDKPYIPAAPFNREILEYFNFALDNRIVNREDRLRLVETIKNIYREYGDYLKRGGNIAFLTNHRSYIDGILVLASQAEAELSLNGEGRAPNTNNHHVISGRSVGLFEMDGVKPNGQPGYMVDDVLHQLGGVFQTIPKDHAMQILESGERIDCLPQGLRRLINSAFLEIYLDILKKGGQTVMLAGSGDEDINVPGLGIVMKWVEKGTTRLLSSPNLKQGEGRTLIMPPDDEELANTPGSLLTIPLFIDCYPWNKKGELIGSAGIGCAVGTPFFARNPEDVHQKGMNQLVILGNECRLPDTPTISYAQVPKLGRAAVEKS